MLGNRKWENKLFETIKSQNMEELIKKIEELQKKVQYWKDKYEDLEERSNELLSRFGD